MGILRREIPVAVIGGLWRQRREIGSEIARVLRTERGDRAPHVLLRPAAIPASEVPPCASCHGPDAKGADAFPRLAGQLHDYIGRKLTNWDKERGQDKANPDNSAIMQPIAHNLTEAQIKAFAAYLSYLE